MKSRKFTAIGLAVTLILSLNSFAYAEETETDTLGYESLVSSGSTEEEQPDASPETTEDLLQEQGSESETEGDLSDSELSSEDRIEEESSSEEGDSLSGDTEVSSENDPELSEENSEEESAPEDLSEGTETEDPQAEDKFDTDTSSEEEEIVETVTEDQAKEETLTVSAASTATIETGYYFLASATDYSLVLDVQSGLKTEGANVRLYRKNFSRGQIFYIKKQSDGYYSIKNLNSKRYLCPSGGTAKKGVSLVQGSTSYTTAGQFTIDESDDGLVIIKSGSTSFTIQGASATAAAGTNAIFGKALKTTTDKWRLVKTDKYGTDFYGVSPYNKMIACISPLADNTKGLQAKEASFASGEMVNIATYQDYDSQKWQLTKTSDGYYLIMNVKSGLVITAKAYGGHTWGASSGTTVIQYNEIEEEYYKQYQKWTIKAASGGGYYLINKATGLYLDLVGGSTANKTELQVSKTASSSCIFTFTEKTTTAYLRWNGYETDSNGESHWLEGTYWDDPKVSDTEFFASAIYTEGGTQGLAGMMMIGYSMLNRVSLSNMRYNIYEFGQYEICRTGTLTKILSAIESGDTGAYSYLPTALTAATNCVNGKAIVLEDTAVVTTPTGSTTYSYGSKISKKSFSIYDGFMTPAAFARNGFTTAGHHTCTYKGHIYYVTSEIWT